MGQKQKTEKERKRERAKVGDNNGQATHGARKHAWRTQAAWDIIPVLFGVKHFFNTMSMVLYGENKRRVKQNNKAA